MKPETALVIYEIRASHPETMAFLETMPPESFLGPDLAEGLLGFHLEADFLFLFFGRKVELKEVFDRFPELELRQVHELRYDQWQDGAGSPPFSIGPLLIRPVFGHSHDKLYSLCPSQAETGIPAPPQGERDILGQPMAKSDTSSHSQAQGDGLGSRLASLAQEPLLI
ncbi:MAG: hypothetical protein LBU69_00390, partial [Deltaproteobacteria bacterium]|nr:hypothetical protein [Deltaproteobacteria bacterium]